MDNPFIYANDLSPTPQAEWTVLAHDVKLAMVRHIFQARTDQDSKLLEVTDVKVNGEVIVQFTEAVNSSRRGGILLDAEEYLKNNIDPGLTLWLSPLGDKNSLRNLRGIEVKS